MTHYPQSAAYGYPAYPDYGQPLSQYPVDSYGQYGYGYQPEYQEAPVAEPERRRRRRRSESGARSRRVSDDGRRRRRRSESGRKRRRREPREVSPPLPEPRQLVQGKEDYVRLLTEIRVWKAVKKRNIVLNVLRMLSDADRTEVIRAAEQAAEGDGPAAAAPPTMPPPVPATDVLCKVNLVEGIEGVGRERLMPGSFVLATRREWGALCLYRHSRGAGNRSPSPVEGPGKVPQWEDLLGATPALCWLFLEITDVTIVDLNVKLKSMGSSSPLKLLLQRRESSEVNVGSVLRAGHRNCRPFPTVDGAVECYADGVEYYPKLADALLSAQHEVLIADWWMTPFVFLKRPRMPAAGQRPEPLDQNFRFDNLLQRIAFCGVKIYILLWKEVTTALALTSQHTETYLESLHPTNIRVLRHRGPLTMTHHQKFVVVDWARVFVGGLDICYGRYDNHDHPIFDPSVTEFIGLDYRNPMLAEENATSQTEAPFRDTLSRAAGQNRMPWHDVHLLLEGRAAYHVGVNFVQRWNHHRMDSKRVKELPILAPSLQGLYTGEQVVAASSLGRCQTKVIRSIAEWSGSPTLESDIHKQWVKMIEKAQHYIYIENQYFISGMLGPEVTNKIAQKIVDRIAQAHQQQETFRVLLVIQPHGEGDPLTNTVIRKIMSYQNQTISKMLRAIREKVGGSQDEVDKHILVTCLRNWGTCSSGRPAYSTIYIHSKLLLVDDGRMILGSANVNDRSMVGDRDSEIGVLIDEACAQKPGGPQEMATLGGKQVPVGKQVRSLRLRLWREHLFGSSTDDSLLTAISDPCSSEAWELIRKRAEENTAAYQTVFPGVPSSTLTTLEEAQRGNAREIGEASTLEERVVGHLCWYPVGFLSQEKKSGDMTTGITNTVSGGTMWY